MLSASAPSLALAQAPELFTSNTVSGPWAFTGAACLTVAGSTTPPSCGTTSPQYQDADGQGWLRLTAGGYASGGAILQNHFSLASGFDVTFTYAMYGGGTPPFVADGLSVFLIDPSVTDAGTGGQFGGSLGYCGIAGGVLGIGLDAYGNWPNNAGGGANQCGGTGPGFQQSNISVRAGANASPAWNYLIGTGVISQATLRTDSGWSYPTGGTCALGDSGCMRTGQMMHISFYPDSTCLDPSSYRLLVKSITNNITVADQCVETARLGTLPSEVELGFGAGTGLAYQYTEIRYVAANAVADLSITKTDNQTTYAPGQIHTYTIVVTNNGPSAADGAVFADPAVAGLNVSSVTCTASSGAACPATTDLTVAAMQSGIAIPTLLAVNSVTFTLTATVAAGTTGDLSNVASIAPPATGVANSGVSCVAAGSTYDATTGICTATDTDTLDTDAPPASDTPGTSPMPIPSLSQWALALLGLAMAGSVMVAMRRRSARR